MEKWNQLSRDCIECDAEDCHNRSPQLTCRSCHAYYFCSDACRNQQDDHPCYHREEAATDWSLREEGTIRTDREAIESALNSRCGICLEVDIIDPVVLTSCKHKFCTPCLVEWMSQSEACAYCRSDTQDLNKHRAIIIQVLARRAAIASDEETKYRILNRALHSAEELVEAAGCGPKTLLVKLKCQSQIPGLERIALETGTEIQSLLEERQNEVFMMQCIAQDQALDEHYNVLSRVLMETSLFHAQVDIMQGELHKSLEEWPEAIEHFERVLLQEAEGEDDHESAVISCSGIYWQLVRCYYEVEDYEKAIDIGQEALEESRHKLEVHKYMALSYKANGDIYAALKIMHRGVLYTLDNGEREEAYELYEELRRELQG